MVAAGQEMARVEGLVGEIKQKEIENEQLKAIIEIMKEEMQQVLEQVSR